MPHSLVVTSGAGDAQAGTGSYVVVGYSIRESSNGAALVYLRDGTSATDPARIVINLGSGGTDTGVVAMVPAIRFGTGVFVDRVSGTTELAIYVM